MPIIHLFLCGIVERGVIEDGWIFLSVVDLPISIFLFAEAFADGHPLFWFGIFGTLWWYLVSWAAWATWQLLGERRRTAGVKAEQDAEAKPGAGDNRAGG